MVYGRTDKGHYGMKAFFASLKICKMLHLIGAVNGVKIPLKGLISGILVGMGGSESNKYG
jgi:hypothetical protein